MINKPTLTRTTCKQRRGWVQGYNAQAAVTENQIVIAAEVMVRSPDFGYLEPIFTATETELEAPGVTDTPGVMIADAGYWHQQQIDEVIANKHIPVLIPPDADRRKSAKPRPGWDGGLYAFMRRVLSTEHGGGIYRKRQEMIEPIFGDIKFNRKIDQFHRRGRSAVRSEWRLITATHNLIKLHNSGRHRRGLKGPATATPAHQPASPTAATTKTPGAKGANGRPSRRGHLFPTTSSSRRSDVTALLETAAFWLSGTTRCLHASSY